MWVGLSAVRVDNVEASRPLSSDTRTGSLVADIEARFSHTTFYHSNLVKCLPLSDDKIRYPTSGEMESCFPHLISEIQALSPQVVLLLGRQVAGHVLRKLGSRLSALDIGFRYRAFMVAGVAYVPIHHPSFVLIYQRRNLKTYMSQIRKVICDNSNWHTQEQSRAAS